MLGCAVIFYCSAVVKSYRFQGTGRAHDGLSFLNSSAEELTFKKKKDDSEERLNQTLVPTTLTWDALGQSGESIRVKGRLLVRDQERTVTAFWGMHYAIAERWKFGKLSRYPCVTRSSGGSCHHTTMPSRVLTGNMAAYMSGRTNERCIQYLLVMGYQGHEDCLYLDIYTPGLQQVGSDWEAVDQEHLVGVIMWLHGGGYVMGDKYQNGMYDGTKFAYQQNVMVVTINYRLGMFGFLSHPELQQNNFGLHDQRLAMYWVKQHAGSFGGNGESITIVGESAGAMSICFHLASPHSRLLYNAAVISSGNCDGPFVWSSIENAKEHGKLFLRAVFGRIRGCHSNKKSGSVFKDAVVAESTYGGHGNFDAWKKTQNSCRDVPRLATVVDRCGKLFGVTLTAHKNDRSLIRSKLPFAGIRPCSNSYTSCDSESPALDKILFECARRLDPEHIWINRFGLIEALPPPANIEGCEDCEVGWMTWLFGINLKSIIGINVTGLPAELPWRPVYGVPSAQREDFRVDEGALTDSIKTGLAQRPLDYLKTAEEPLSKPVIIGFNKDEGSLFVPCLTAFAQTIDQNGRSTASLTLADLDSLRLGELVLCRHAKSWCPDLTKLLQPLPRYNGVQDVMKNLITDYLFACPQLRTARALARKHENKVWVYDYRVDDVLPNIADAREKLGAHHMTDVFATFNKGNMFLGGGGFLSWTPNNQTVSESYQGSIVRLRQAAGDENPSWKPLSPEPADDDNMRVYDVNGVFEENYQASAYDFHHCSIWDQLAQHEASN